MSMGSDPAHVATAARILTARTPRMVDKVTQTSGTVLRALGVECRV